jgi:hypothetical protein
MPMFSFRQVVKVNMKSAIAGGIGQTQPIGSARARATKNHATKAAQTVHCGRFAATKAAPSKPRATSSNSGGEVKTDAAARTKSNDPKRPERHLTGLA